MRAILSQQESPRVYRRPAIDLCMEYCEEQGISDAKGMLQLRGFYGTYQVTVRHGGKTKVVTVPFEQQGEGNHNIWV